MIHPIIKKYKQLDNHKISGQISKLDRLKERSLIITFYSPAIKFNTNFAPILQQDFLLKNFFLENFFHEKKQKIFSKYLIKENPEILLNKKTSFFFFQNTFYKENIFWKKFFNIFLLKKQFLKIKKKFYRVEIFKNLCFLQKIKNNFLNQNIKNSIYNLYFGEFFYKKILKQFQFQIHWCILLKFFTKKRKNLPFFLRKKIWSGFLVQLPGLSHLFFIPFSFWSKTFTSLLKKKYTSKEFLHFLKPKLSQFYFFQINILKTKKSNIKKIQFTFN